MEFILPKFGYYKDYVIAVYRISFDRKYFYIGSSTDVRRRFRRWKCVFNNPDYIKNKRIREVVSSSNCIEFEILSRLNDENKLRQHEKKLIIENSSNELFLNKVTGLPHPKIKKYKPPSEKITPPIRIALFDLKGNLIKEYNSKREVGREHKGCRLNLINKVLRGEMEFAGGFKFKLILADGSYLEPKPYIRKDTYRRDDFYQIDKAGKIVGVFTHTGDAAKSSGALAGNINAILSKTRKYAMGFTFVYVAEYNTTH